MSKLNLNDQIQITIKVLTGEKVAPIARHYRVSRQTIHTWCNIAYQAISQALSPKKSGPKPISEVKKLKKTIANLQKAIDSMRIPLATKETKYTIGNFKCPKCNNLVIWKNGTITLKSGETQQRFICSKCKIRLYPPDLSGDYCDDYHIIPKIPSKKITHPAWK